MCAASDKSISTLKCPDSMYMSFSYLPSSAKKPFKLAFQKGSPNFFWKYLLSLSVCLSVSSPLHFFFSFFIPQFQGFHTENTQIFTSFHSPE